MFITQIVFYDKKKKHNHKTLIYTLLLMLNITKNCSSSSINIGKAGKQQVLYMSSDFPTPPITNISNLKTLPNE